MRFMEPSQATTVSFMFGHLRCLTLPQRPISTLLTSVDVRQPGSGLDKRARGQLWVGLSLLRGWLGLPEMGAGAGQDVRSPSSVTALQLVGSTRGWWRRRRLGSAVVVSSQAKASAGAHGVVGDRHEPQWVHCEESRACTPSVGGSAAVAALVLDRGFFFPTNAAPSSQLVARAVLGQPAKVGLLSPGRKGGLAASRSLWASVAALGAAALLWGTAGACGRRATGGLYRWASTPTSAQQAGWWSARRRILGRLQRRQAGGNEGLFLSNIGSSLGRQRAARWLAGRYGTAGTHGAAHAATHARARLGSRSTHASGATWATLSASSGAEGRVGASTRSRAFSSSRLQAVSGEFEQRFKQPQVRYKPGMVTHWRQYRQSFCKAAHVAWGWRQKRLTAYVARLRRVSAFAYVSLQEMTALRVLLNSRLVLWLQPEAGLRLLLAGAVGINHARVMNPLTQLYLSDLLLLRVPATCSQFSGVGVGVHSGRQLRRLTRADCAVWSDAPEHLEVDELLMGVFILGERRLPSLAGAPVTPFLTLKCYNWKYVT